MGWKRNIPSSSSCSFHLLLSSLSTVSEGHYINVLSGPHHHNTALCVRSTGKICHQLKEDRAILSEARTRMLEDVAAITRG
jgi:hypothetical protein